jgi:peptidylprolyl isomerase
MSEQNTTGQQQTAAERAAAAKSRGQALIGAGAGLAVIAVLIGTFAWIQVSDGDDVSAAAPAASAAAPVTSEEPSPAEPAPSDAPPSAEAAVPGEGGLVTPPALVKAPVVKGGRGELTKTKVTYLIKGKGPAITKGQMIAVNYTGVIYKTGKPFDSSWSRHQPFVTQIGVGKVIPGWDQAMIGVRVGSRVQLDIPADLAYGEAPQDGAPGGDLRFVVDVLASR